MAHQAPRPMEFSRQGYWSGLPFPSPGVLPDTRIELRSPALQADPLPSELPAAESQKQLDLSLIFESEDKNRLKCGGLSHQTAQSPALMYRSGELPLPSPWVILKIFFERCKPKSFQDRLFEG